jgi:tetratricopeptide (TPR) repeat protein
LNSILATFRAISFLAAIRAASIIAISLALGSAIAQTQSQTALQARQQMLQELDAGRLREAVLQGQQAASGWPRDAELRHYLGVAYFKSGDGRQAQEQLERARELNPNDSAIHFDLGLVFLSAQNYAGTANELEATVKLSHSNALAHVLLGRAYLNTNRSLQAIDEFKTALKLEPAIKLGHYHLGFAYYSLGRNDEAISEYKEELKRSGESPTVVCALGHSLLASGKYEAAETFLQRGTELDGGNSEVWYDLGKARALGGAMDGGRGRAAKVGGVESERSEPALSTGAGFGKTGEGRRGAERKRTVCGIEEGPTSFGGDDYGSRSVRRNGGTILRGTVW